MSFYGKFKIWQEGKNEFKRENEYPFIYLFFFVCVCVWGGSLMVKVLRNRSKHKKLYQHISMLTTLQSFLLIYWLLQEAHASQAVNLSSRFLHFLSCSPGMLQTDRMQKYLPCSRQISDWLLDTKHTACLPGCFLAPKTYGGGGSYLLSQFFSFNFLKLRGNQCKVTFWKQKQKT